MFLSILRSFLFKDGLKTFTNSPETTKNIHTKGHENGQERLTVKNVHEIHDRPKKPKSFAKPRSSSRFKTKESLYFFNLEPFVISIRSFKLTIINIKKKSNSKTIRKVNNMF